MGPSTTTAASTPTGAAPGPEVAAAGPMPELVPPDQWADPHPHYHRLRYENPVWSIPEWDEVVCTRRADCARVLRDSTFSSDTDRRRITVPVPSSGEMERTRPPLLMHPPARTQHRKQVRQD